MTSCNLLSNIYDNDRRWHVHLPSQELTTKEPFRGVVAMDVPRKSNLNRFPKKNLATGEAGSIDGTGIEQRPVYQWEMRLYDAAAEQGYQSSARRREFKGKGLSRQVSKTEQVVRFDLPHGLWNYPGGEQSMFRYDKKSVDGSLVVRTAIYSLDELLGSEEDIQASHKQIQEMLESIRFVPQR